MIYLSRSLLDPRIVEIRDKSAVFHEVEVLFSIQKFPKTFFSVEEALEWLSKIELKMAKTKAFQLLARRAYPSITILEKLTDKGFSNSICQRVVEELKKLYLLEDEDFWERLILRELARGFGPRYLEWKKKVPREKLLLHITEAMQREKIRELAKKCSSLKKAFAFLMRRGFDLDCIQRELS